MKLKICGLKDPKNIAEVAALNPDMIGLNFYEGSKRFVGNGFRPKYLRSVPSSVLKTGIFVNENPDQVIKRIKQFSLDFVQLHGFETPLECRLIRKHAKIIKAFGVKDGFDFGICTPYEEVCDLFLFDTADPQYGGTGRTFNHCLLRKYYGALPFLLSGGIGINEAERIVGSDIHSLLIGIDVNSKFEKANQLKDVTQLEKLNQILKHEVKI